GGGGGVGGRRAGRRGGSGPAAYTGARGAIAPCPAAGTRPAGGTANVLKSRAGLLAIGGALAGVRAGLGVTVAARAPLFVHRIEPSAGHAALRGGRGRPTSRPRRAAGKRRRERGGSRAGPAA